MSDHIPAILHMGPLALQVIRVELAAAADTISGEEIGHYSQVNQRVTVANGVPPAIAWQSLFHEWGHAVADRAGRYEEIGEPTVELFGWAILHLLLENPGLQAELIRGVRESA